MTLVHFHKMSTVDKNSEITVPNSGKRKLKKDTTRGHLTLPKEGLFYSTDILRRKYTRYELDEREK